MDDVRDERECARATAAATLTVGLPEGDDEHVEGDRARVQQRHRRGGAEQIGAQLRRRVVAELDGAEGWGGGDGGELGRRHRRYFKPRLRVVSQWLSRTTYAVTACEPAARAGWAAPLEPVYAARAGCRITCGALIATYALARSPLAQLPSAVTAAGAMTPLAPMAFVPQPGKNIRPRLALPVLAVRSVMTAATSSGCALPVLVP